MSYSTIGNVRVKLMITGLEYFVPSGMSGAVFDKWKYSNRKALLAFENSRGNTKADDNDEPVIEPATSKKYNKMSKQDIMAFDHIQTSSYESKGKRLGKEIQCWKEERDALANSDQLAIKNLNLHPDHLYSNVERLRREVRISEAKEELNKVDQILAYRMVNINLEA